MDGVVQLDLDWRLRVVGVAIDAGEHLSAKTIRVGIAAIGEDRETALNVRVTEQTAETVNGVDETAMGFVMKMPGIWMHSGAFAAAALVSSSHAASSRLVLLT